MPKKPRPLYGGHCYQTGAEREAAMQEYELTPRLTGREYGEVVSETGEVTFVEDNSVPLAESVSASNYPSVPYNPWVCPLCGSEELEQDAVLSVNGPEDSMIVSTGDIWCTNDQCENYKFEIEPVRKSDYKKEDK